MAAFIHLELSPAEAASIFSRRLFSQSVFILSADILRRGLMRLSGSRHQRI
jgi:hypothetical protein